jgi:RNA polymerase sigma-70 factor (ECF subfamily)
MRPGRIDFGNEEDFKEAFHCYYHPLCFYAGRILGGDYVMSDIVQEVFCGAWELKVAFESIYAMKAYLYASTFNACLNRKKSTVTHQRHHAVIRCDGQRAPHEEVSFLADRIEAEVFSEIFRAIEQLPLECRKVFKLSYIQGQSVEAVATELGISVNTVKTQRSRAKKLLKESLKNLYYLLFLTAIP